MDYKELYESAFKHAKVFKMEGEFSKAICLERYGNAITELLSRAEAAEARAEAAEKKAADVRPVRREQVDKVFPGCPMCENGLPKIHIPAFQALAICNQHMNHEAFDIELNSKFCLNCGRPLTDEAVEMVMERLEALYASDT